MGSAWFSIGVCQVKAIENNDVYVGAFSDMFQRNYINNNCLLQQFIDLNFHDHAYGLEATSLETMDVATCSKRRKIDSKALFKYD